MNMDALAGLLDGPRARGAFVLRSILNPPWSLRIEDHAPITLMTMLRGTAWVVHAGVDPTPVNPGDVVIMRGPEPYTVADNPATPPQVIIHPDQTSTTVGGDEACATMDLGVRTWGNDLEGSTMMLSGTYLLDSEVSGRLLAALPTLLLVPAGRGTSPLVDLLADEMVRDDPGQAAILDRLLDSLFISVLRIWFSTPEAEAPGWFLAHGDAVVGPALRMMYDNPAHPWTIAILAEEVGVSRASLARRFTALVGEPPMKFLTGWRLALAADLLREPEHTIGSVARQVGYASPYALSTAFKRVNGVSPKQYRTSRAPTLANAP